MVQRAETGSAAEAVRDRLVRHLRAFLATLPARLNSLTARVLLYTTVWSVIGLVILAFVISNLYAAGAERNLRDLLRTPALFRRQLRLHRSSHKGAPGPAGAG